MKTIISTVILFLSVNSFAQRGTNPAYDPSVDPYADLLKDTARGKRTARFLKYLMPLDYYRDKFQTSPCNDYIVLADTRIEQFNKMVSSFPPSDADPKQMKMAEAKYQKEGVGSVVERLNYEMSYIEKQGTFTSDANQPIENLICRVKGSLQCFKNNLTYLEAVKKYFPSTPGVDDAIQLAKDGIQKYNTNKTIMAMVKGNKNAALADVFIPKAVATKAEWEGWFKNYFTKAFPGYTIIRNNLQSANWYVKKNEISGLPEYRQIGTKIGAKAPDGKCFIFTLDIYQDYIGGKFSESRFENSGKQEMLCENLK
jgi:hypothetical protein